LPVTATGAAGKTPPQGNERTAAEKPEKAKPPPPALAAHFDPGDLVAGGFTQVKGVAGAAEQPGEKSEGIEGWVARGRVRGAEFGEGAGEGFAEEFSGARDGVGGFASALVDEGLCEAGQGGPRTGECGEFGGIEGGGVREGGRFLAELRAGGGIRAEAGDGRLELG
jgi:hypothetical protein